MCQSSPKIEGWEFLAAKPRKAWNKCCVDLTFDGEIKQYLFDDWKYGLISFNDGEFFDVNLIPGGRNYDDSEALKYAADLFVEFELGELTYMELIDKVNIIEPKRIGV